MGGLTGGEGGASRGGSWQQSLTVQQPSPPPASSTNQSAGTALSRLFALFEESVNNGVQAKLETYRRREAVCVDFTCRIVIGESAEKKHRRSEKRRNWNRERSKKWREAMKESRPAPAASTSPPAASSPAEARSFAEVAAQPASKKDIIVTPQAVRTAEMAAAGQRGPKATRPDPKKAAKSTLAASRVSQRAALLSKKRVAEAAKLPATSPSAADEDEAPPEVMRATPGDSSLLPLDISLDASPPSPPPLELTRVCGCESDCEDDFHEELIDKGVRLNTTDPHWEEVFTRARGMCRFCHVECKPTGVGECPNCAELSIFQCVKKFAPRWFYPKC